MTEAEWLSSDFDALARYITNAHPGGWCGPDGRPGRKLLLACCALARSAVGYADNPQSLAELELAERNAEGMLTGPERLEAMERVRLLRARSQSSSSARANGVLALAFGHQPNALIMCGKMTWMAHGSDTADPHADIRLLDDIFGNPFRPVAFSAEWRTSTAVALARHMYESRDFSAMPILADALQDAGCNSDDILSHCRDEKGTHVRGCWVVDLVLGKS